MIDHSEGAERTQPETVAEHIPEPLLILMLEEEEEEEEEKEKEEEEEA